MCVSSSRFFFLDNEGWYGTRRGAENKKKFELSKKFGRLSTKAIDKTTTTTTTAATTTATTTTTV